jgi:flagellar hook protein FlgE
MALGTVLHTALSGVSAARFSVGVIGNNLANLNTNGFKASGVSFSTQVSATRGKGSSPSDSSGGTNPRQTGLGVMPGASLADFGQGTIAINSRSTSLALQGDGFFILEGSQGENLYTRNGNFSLNGAGQLVNSDGRRVLGAGVNENFEIQPGKLSPLSLGPGMQVKSSDGSVATLTVVSVAEDGRIQGSFTDGIRRDLGQIQVARFANPSGLQQRGGTTYASGPNSGLPVESPPGAAGAASITGGAVELSNTNIGQSLVDLSISSTQFRANLAVMSAAEGMLDDLLNVQRPN